MANAKGIPDSDTQSDIQTLNRALFFEHQGVWAYRAAGGKLSASEVGRAVRAIADENRADHEKHQVVPVVANPVLNASTRTDWMMKV